jgi:hypothetical protein
MPTNLKLKNLSIIYFKDKKCEFKRNENVEILSKERGSVALYHKDLLLDKDRQEELELQKDTWIILPAFVDLCADFTSNSSTNARDVQRFIKDKWAAGVGLTVALLPEHYKLDASNCESDLLDSIVQFTSSTTTKTATTPTPPLWNQEKTIKVDSLNGSIYSFNHYGITVSPFPDAEAGYLYGSGNPLEQSISPWTYALSKGPKQDFKKTLFEMTRSLEESMGSGIASTTCCLSNSMVLKIDPRWDLSSCGKLATSSAFITDYLRSVVDSILKSIFMHGGNNNKVSALYSAKGNMLYSCQEWKDALQQASMEKYYTQENDKSIAISNGHHQHKHIFNTIPESIEAFSM